MPTELDAVREDVVDGLTSGEVAGGTDAFRVEVQRDGSLIADFGDQDFVFTVTIARTPRRR
jgi:hypothetical protein